ncbi:hypothetical protein FRC12_010885 [Ceratobasidium sp. 428]|nr:hypothetical protein FRC12_010885 [Ceratobasidium sp. 428]
MHCDSKSKLGEGSLGQVLKAADRDTGQVMAFNKMKFHLKRTDSRLDNERNQQYEGAKA